MLSRGVCPVNFTPVEQLRVLAAVTGIVLALAAIALGLSGSADFDMIASLAAAIAGFEVFFFGQQVAQRRNRSRG
jgi:hypothetical protein